MNEKTVYVTTVTVVDPDTKLPVEIEIHKCVDSGAMVGIDASYLATDIEDVRNPYNDGFLYIGDDE
jgi:hypothetical protein